MNRLVITQGQKITETTVTVWSNKTIETMDWLYDGQKTLLNQRLDFEVAKRLKLWID